MVRAGDRRNATKAFEYMSSLEAPHSVATMCGLPGVSRSGFYAWTQRAPSQRAGQDLKLSANTKGIHEYSRGIYGAPRIHAELAFGGTHVGRKWVARLMRVGGGRKLHKCGGRKLHTHSFMRAAELAL